MKLQARLAAMAAASAILVVTSCGSGRPSSRIGPTITATTLTPSTSSPTTSAAATTVGPPSISVAPTTIRPSSPAVTVTHGRSDRRVVALTFDAGSDAGNTARILDILAADHIPATFGITGLWAQANPKLVQRITAAGHQIVNHSWDHQSFTGYSTKAAPLTAAQITQELARTDNLIGQLTGAGTAGWFRSPYGDRNSAVDAIAGTAGYRYDLMWTVDTLGWKGAGVDTIVQRCLASAAPGEIILMHVGSASTDASALPDVIAALQAGGYGFATASGIV